MPSRLGVIPEHWPSRRSSLQELRIEPHVLVIRRDQEAPAGWQREVRDYLGCVTAEMRHMRGVEELRIVGQFASPDVPTRRVAFRLMTESVHRPIAPMKTEADFLVVRCGERLDAVPPTNGCLFSRDHPLILASFRNTGPPDRADLTLVHDVVVSS